MFQTDCGKVGLAGARPSNAAGKWDSRELVLPMPRKNGTRGARPSNGGTLGRQFPITVIRPAEQPGCFGITNDLLAFVIPFDRPLHEHGDQSQMARNGRMMRGFDRRNGWLTGFDAIDEVLL